MPMHYLWDYNSSFKDLLKDNSFVSTIEISRVAVELFKVKENFPNTIMSDIFPTRVLNYSLRSQTDFLRITVNTTKFGLNSLRHFTSKVWIMIPTEIKNSSTDEMFKSKISKREPNDCKFCQDYLHRIGYVILVDAWSVLIMVIPDSRDSFTYKLEGCCEHLQMC